MNKIKPYEEMTDEELVETYKIACDWTSKRMQVTGTNKNELGEEITQEKIEEFEIALKKIEKLEDLMRARKINYGR